MPLLYIMYLEHRNILLVIKQQDVKQAKSLFVMKHIYALHLRNKSNNILKLNFQHQIDFLEHQLPIMIWKTIFLWKKYLCYDDTYQIYISNYISSLEYYERLQNIKFYNEKKVFINTFYELDVIVDQTKDFFYYRNSNILNIFYQGLSMIQQTYLPHWYIHNMTYHKDILNAYVLNYIDHILYCNLGKQCINYWAYNHLDDEIFDHILGTFINYDRCHHMKKYYYIDLYFNQLKNFVHDHYLYNNWRSIDYIRLYKYFQNEIFNIFLPNMFDRQKILHNIQWILHCKWR